MPNNLPVSLFSNTVDMLHKYCNIPNNLPVALFSNTVDMLRK